MDRQRALWATTEAQGGIATYVRVMQQTELWTDWNIRCVVTHRENSQVVKVGVFASAMARFIVELVRFRPNVVHLHAASDTSFVRKGILLWISRLARVPVVLHMHGSGFNDYFDRSPRAVQQMIRSTLRHASAVVALGKVRADRLWAIAPGARITVIPNAVRLGRRVGQPAANEPVRVVFLGRIGERKGTFRLLDAWAELARDPGFTSGPGKIATLTIAGDGEVERARHRIRELHLEDTVEVCGWLQESAVGELLDHAHVLVLPSRNEGQPMAVLEAMARGLCIVASDVGGLPEMIGGGCGLVVPPDDIEAIASALRLVITDRELRAACGAAAYTRVADQFDVGTVSRRLDALYREVVR